LASAIKLTVGKNPLTSFWDKLERITIFWETILMEKWDRKDTFMTFTPNAKTKGKLDQSQISD
jgi:hypothetical protein